MIPTSIGAITTALAIPPSPRGSAIGFAIVQAVEPGWRSWLATATDVATIIIALALLLAAAIFLGIALMLRKLLRRVDPLIKQVQSHVDPVMGHVRDVGENVNYMSSAIRADVQHVSELVDTTRRRLNRTADAAEQRIREFNALLAVMQEEAEAIFIDTASTLRGVRAGTESYRQVAGDGDGETARRRSPQGAEMGE